MRRNGARTFGDLIASRLGPGESSASMAHRLSSWGEARRHPGGGHATGTPFEEVVGRTGAGALLRVLGDGLKRKQEREELIESGAL